MTPFHTSHWPSSMYRLQARGPSSSSGRWTSGAATPAGGERAQHRRHSRVEVVGGRTAHTGTGPHRSNDSCVTRVTSCGERGLLESSTCCILSCGSCSSMVALASLSAHMYTSSIVSTGAAPPAAAAAAEPSAAPTEAPSVSVAAAAAALPAAASVAASCCTDRVASWAAACSQGQGTEERCGTGGRRCGRGGRRLAGGQCRAALRATGTWQAMQAKQHRARSRRGQVRGWQLSAYRRYQRRQQQRGQAAAQRVWPCARHACRRHRGGTKRGSSLRRRPQAPGADAGLVGAPRLRPAGSASPRAYNAQSGRVDGGAGGLDAEILPKRVPPRSQRPPGRLTAVCTIRRAAVPATRRPCVEPGCAWSTASRDLVRQQGVAAMQRNGGEE